MTSTADELLSQLKRVMADLEGLASAAAASGAEGGAAMTDKLKEALSDARHRIDELDQSLRRGARTADKYVHEHTWTSIAIAAGIAFLIGVLYRRRD